MKKILFVLLAGALLIGPLSATAIEGVPNTCTLSRSYVEETGIAACTANAVINVDTTPGASICCTLEMVHNVTDWVFYFVLILAVLMLVIGGAFYITAAGDPEKAGRGKMILTLSVVGLVIAIIAKLIPSLVRFFVGM
jgi:hypothetical protein